MNRNFSKRAVICRDVLLPAGASQRDDPCRFPSDHPPPREAPVKKQISAVLAVLALAVMAACGSTPTANDAAPADWQANDVPAEAPQDTTTGRGPNLFGSGN